MSHHSIARLLLVKNDLLFETLAAFTSKITLQGSPSLALWENIQETRGGILVTFLISVAKSLMKVT